MKLNKYELIIIVLGLLCTGALIIYNAVSAPPLNTQVAYYTMSGVSSNDEKLTSVQNEEAQTSVSGYTSENSSAISASAAESAPESRKENSFVSSSVSSSASHPGSSAATRTGKLNINSATADELMTLDGIGEVFAKRIIEYREKNGGFLTTDELKLVEGIGDKRYEAIKDYVTVE